MAYFTETDKRKGLPAQAILLILSVAMLLFVLVRAENVSITYDEAFTYMRFVQRIDPKDLHSLRFEGEEAMTNNHWLNTLMIFVFDRLFHTSYDEFVIRLPSVLFFAGYLILVNIGFRKKLYSFACAVALLSNYYLTEFYSLARGYGMAQTFVFCACLFYLAWKDAEYKKDRYLIGCAASLAAGLSANTILLFIMPSFGLMWLYHLMKEKQLLRFLRERWWFLVLFFSVSGITAWHQMKISEGKFDLGETGFYRIVLEGCIRMFVNKPALVICAAAALAVAILLSVALLRGRIIECDFFLMLVVFFLVDFLESTLLKSEYIAGRFLLPFYGLAVLGFYQLFHAAGEELLKKKPSIRKASVASAAVLTLFMIFQFSNKLNFNEPPSDWKFDTGRKEEVLAAYIVNGEFIWGPDEKKSQSGPFYEDKYEEIVEKYGEQTE